MSNSMRAAFLVALYANVTLQTLSFSGASGGTPTLSQIKLSPTATYNLTSGKIETFNNQPADILGTINQTGGIAIFRNNFNLAGTYILKPAGSSTITPLLEAGTATLNLELDGTTSSAFAHITTTTSSL